MLRACPVVLAAVLALGPAHAAEKARPTRAVWLHPAPLTLFSLVLDERALLLPVGVHWPMGDNMELVSELTVGRGLPAYCGPTALSVWGAVGSSFRLEGAGPLQGGFVQPKLIMRHNQGGAPRCLGDDDEDFASDSLVAAGVDFGVQRTFGSLYAAVLLGMQVGYCWNCPAQALIDFGPFANDTPRGNRVKVGFNVNFLRLGYAF